MERASDNRSILRAGTGATSNGEEGRTSRPAVLATHAHIRSHGALVKAAMLGMANVSHLRSDESVAYPPLYYHTARHTLTIVPSGASSSNSLSVRAAPFFLQYLLRTKMDTCW